MFRIFTPTAGSLAFLAWASVAGAQDKPPQNKPDSKELAKEFTKRFVFEYLLTDKNVNDAATKAMFDTILGIKIDQVKSPGEKVLGVKIALDEKIKEVDGASEELETVFGVKRKFKRSRSVQHTTTTMDTSSLEGKAGVDLKVLNAEIKKLIETSTGKMITDSITVEEEFEIDGDKVQKVKLVWCDQFRTGTIEVRTSKATKTMPYEFRMGTKLNIKPVK